MSKDSLANWVSYAVMTGIVTVMAIAGMWATDIGSWYQRLSKPSWQPPDWVFGPVWTTIFVLLVVSVGRAWNVADSSQQFVLAVAVMVNLLLNMLWSVLFFRLRRPSWALIEVVALWLSIIFLMGYTYSLDAVSAWLISPYLLWVSVAAYLTLTIVRLNPNAHAL